MEEIITSIQNWQVIRNQPDLLIELFSHNLGFELDVSQFPPKKPLHAYAAIKNGEFGFYVISEVNDIESPDEVLSSNCYWCPCVNAFTNPQEIPQAVAISRVNSWRNNYREWINEVVNTPFGMYEIFYIPTEGLKRERYMALFALKNNDITPTSLEADLVLVNNSGVCYDTIHGEPPYRDKPKYYILNLI